MSIESEIPYLSRKGVCSRLKICSHTLSRKLRNEEFPKHDREHRKAHLWKESTVVAWLGEHEESELNILDE